VRQRGEERRDIIIIMPLPYYRGERGRVQRGSEE